MDEMNAFLKASLVIEERTSEVKLAMTFEKNLGGRSTIFLDRDVCEHLPELRKLLLKNGAAIPGDRTTQIELLDDVVASMDQLPRILPRAGWSSPLCPKSAVNVITTAPLAVCSHFRMADVSNLRE
jgi:hypothetical protein